MTKLQDKWKYFRKILRSFPLYLIDMNWGNKTGFPSYSPACYKAPEKWSWNGVLQIANGLAGSLINSKLPKAKKKKKKKKWKPSKWFKNFRSIKWIFIGHSHKIRNISGQWVLLSNSNHMSYSSLRVSFFWVMKLFWFKEIHLWCKPLQWEIFEYELHIR